VLPVFQSVEDKALRDAYLQLTDYICLSPNQNLSEAQRFAWAQDVHVAGVKFHGLATTGNRMLSRVDWYSVDSSGWLMVAAMGNILFPIGDRLQPLSLSDTAPTAKQDAKHLSTMPERPWIIDQIRRRGYHEDSLAKDYAARICWNIDMWNSPPWRKEVRHSPGLFA